MPDCPTCKKPMEPESSEFIDFEIKQGDTGMGKPFPEFVEMILFENYICYECGSRTRQAVERQHTKTLK